jgi:hypothetical protein
MLHQSTHHTGLTQTIRGYSKTSNNYRYKVTGVTKEVGARETLKLASQGKARVDYTSYKLTDAETVMTKLKKAKSGTRPISCIFYSKMLLLNG